MEMVSVTVIKDSPVPASEIVGRALRDAAGSPANPFVKVHLGNFPNHAIVGFTRLDGLIAAMEGSLVVDM